MYTAQRILARHVHVVLSTVYYSRHAFQRNSNSWNLISSWLAAAVTPDAIKFTFSSFSVFSRSLGVDECLAARMRGVNKHRVAFDGNKCSDTR